ncbi:MAG: hybrid sensor histidine kinase/response regulator [Ardenticatenaceae bacterium]|nr:hybrid sensor histidine kinase/response regulator [Ardenticatenaceae bacterium]
MSDIPTNIDILIVDDVPDNLRLLSRMLQRRGYEIRTAKSGPEALEFFEEAMAELVLLDVNMPGMDGYDVCRRLKANDRLKEIPVIFLSALSEPSDKLRGFESGGVDYVTKPFHFHEVIARVETHLELYRQKQENRRLREQEREKFEQITHLKDQVLNTATHDLKNPLTSIKLSVTLLHKMLEDANEKVIHYLNKIEFDTSRMLRLINDLVDLATVDMSSEIELKTVDLDHFVRRAINEVSARLQQTGVQVEIEAPDPKLRAVFDGVQISHVIENLLANLIKFIPQNGVVVISYKREGKDLIIRGELADGYTEVTPESKELNHIKLGFALLTVIVEQHGGKIKRLYEDQAAFELHLPYRSPEQNDSQKKTIEKQPAAA